MGPATSHYVAEDAGGHYLMEDECKPQEAPRRSSHVIMNPYADEVLPGPRAGSDGYIVPMTGPLSGQTSSRASLDPAGRPSTDGVGYIDAINAIHGPSPLRESSQQGPPPQSHYLQEDAVLAAGLFKEELSQKEKAAAQPAARHAPANHYVTEDTLTGLGPASAASSSAASPLRAPAALEPSTPPRPAPTLTAGSPLRTLGTLASASPPRAAAWSPASSTQGTSEDLPRPMNHYQDLDDPRARDLPRYPSFDGRNLLSPDQFAESEV